MEAVRAQAVRGFTLFPRGGMEIGGVLYGERRGDVTRVLAVRELECRHEMGPRFVLSEHDEESFRDLLKPHNGLRAVGWYCSHTKGGVTLTANDCAILERFFPDRGSVALLVKPDRFGPAEATFHVQGYADPGPRFSVLPPPKQTVLTAIVETASAPEAVAAPVPAPIEPVAAAQVELAVAAPVAAPLPAPVAAPGPTPAATEAPPASWPALPAVPSGPLLLRWAGFGGGAAVAIMALITLWPGSRVATADARVGLQVFAIADRQLRIEWDRSTPAVQDARAATVEIVDGRTKYTLPLSAAQLRTGSLTYGHQTDTVDVQMKLATGAVERVKLVTVPPDPVSPSPDPKPSPLASARAAVAPPPSPPQQAEPVASRQPVATAAVAPRPAPQQTVSVAPAPPEAATSRQPLAMSAQATSPDLSRADRAAPAPAPPSRKQFALAEQPQTESSHVALPDPPPAISAALPPPPAAVKLPLSGSAPVPIVVHAAQSGRLIWTGYLERREVVEFDGSKPSIGSVSGTLPARPMKLLAAFPAEFKRDLLTVYTTDAARHERGEAPGPLTGFNRLHFIWDPERVKQIAVVETPAAGNQFARLVLRNEGRSCRAIVVEWRTE